MNDIIRISKTIKNEPKEHFGFLSKFLGTLCDTLLEVLSTDKDKIRVGELAIVRSQGCKGNMPAQGTFRAGQNF